jgi:hypothetical protein
MTYDNNLFLRQHLLRKMKLLLPIWFFIRDIQQGFQLKDVNNYNICYISQQSNHQFLYQALRTLQDQQCQLYKQKKDYGSRTLFLPKKAPSTEESQHGRMYLLKLEYLSVLDLDSRKEDRRFLLR